MSVCITPEHNNNNDSSPAPRPPIPGREAVIPWTDEYPPESPSKESSQLTPSYFRWAEDLHYLLQDSEGVALFKRFLEQQSSGNALDFWFACQGFKHNVDPTDSAKIYQLIKVIARTYIRGDSAVSAIDASTKRTIIERITQKVGLDQNIFDEAQQEVEQLLRASCYPVFLKSDLYVQYVTTNGFLQPSSSVSSQLECGGCHEPDISSSETQHSKSSCKLTSSSTAAPLTTENLMVSRRYRSELSCSNRSESKSLEEPLPNPYHISYAPVSAQDSELQSHSSEAHTDDTKSHTDSSLENGPGASKKVWKSNRRCAGRKTSSQGISRDTSLPHNLLLTRIERDYRGGHCSTSCTDHHHAATVQAHVSKDRNLAESDPVSFAHLLTESLVKMQNQVKSHRSYRCVAETVGEEMGDPSGIASAPAGPVDPADTSDLGSGEENSGIFLTEEPWAGRFLAAVRAGRGNLQQDAQSILEEHCSRIWENSAEETPAGKGTRSPGLLTQPNTKSIRSNPHVTSVVPAPVGSTASFDSGVTPDFYTEHRHVHHYHYYHNPSLPAPPPGSSVSGSSQSQLLSGRQPGHIMVPGATRSNSSKTPRSKASDTGDSGVSMLYDKLDPNNDKVLNWIRENEKSDLCASVNPKTPLQSWVAHQALLTAPADQPRQPLCMPPLNPPDPTTQLEEAKRRLLLTAACNASSHSPTGKMAKSTSFPNQCGVGQATIVTSSRKQSDARTQSNTSTLSGPSEKPMPCIMSQSTSDPFGGPICDSCLVVGYYLCGDPVPYRSQWSAKEITLGQFKQLIAKKGNYRYFFKKACNEFDTGVVHEELTADEEILPLWEGKVVAKVERID